MSKSFKGMVKKPPHSPKAIIVAEPKKTGKKEQPIQQKEKKKASQSMAIYFDIAAEYIDEDGYVEMKVPAPRQNPEKYRLKMTWEPKQ